MPDDHIVIHITFNPYLLLFGVAVLLAVVVALSATQPGQAQSSADGDASQAIRTAQRP